MPSDGPIRQMLGETHAGVSHLVDVVRDMRADMIRQNDAMERELRTIKHDARNHEQVVQGRLELADRRSGELERRLGVAELQATQNALAIQSAVDRLKEATAPIDGLMEFRSRLAWGGIILAGAVTFIWVFVGPVYSNLISRIFPP